MGKLLTPAKSNPKTAKDAGVDVEAAILHLAPTDLAGRGNVCPWASRECARLCLNTAGRSQVRGDVNGETLSRYSIHRARIRRTRLFFDDRAGFFSQLRKELRALQRRAERRGARAVVRLNGTSDLPWERLRDPADGRTMPEAFPTVQFYDYTKSVNRAMESKAMEHWPANYHLTYSRSEDTTDNTLRLLMGAGVNVAVVFEGETLPVEWSGARVIDGTAHDFRYLDPAGVVVGLLAKGRLKREASPFKVTI